MTYINNAEMASLSDDPMEAFVELESIVRQRYQEADDNRGNNGNGTLIMNRYVADVFPAARFYGISALSNLPRPTPNDYQALSEFMSEVDYILTDLRLRNIARAKKNSVALDAATKARFRSQLNEIRETVDKLDVPVAKREALYERINALQEEIDRERTRTQAFNALMFEVLHGISEAGEPLVKQIERLGAAMGYAIETEASRPKLPPPKEPKRIEGPKQGYGAPENGGYFAPIKKRKNGSEKPMDDEIPF